MRGIIQDKWYSYKKPAYVLNKYGWRKSLHYSITKLQVYDINIYTTYENITKSTSTSDVLKYELGHDIRRLLLKSPHSMLSPFTSLTACRVYSPTATTQFEVILILFICYNMSTIFTCAMCHYLCINIPYMIVFNLIGKQENITLIHSILVNAHSKSSLFIVACVE